MTSSRDRTSPCHAQFLKSLGSRHRGRRNPEAARVFWHVVLRRGCTAKRLGKWAQGTGYTLSTFALTRQQIIHMHCREAAVGESACLPESCVDCEAWVLRSRTRCSRTRCSRHVTCASSPNRTLTRLHYVVVRCVRCTHYSSQLQEIRLGTFAR